MIASLHGTVTHVTLTGLVIDVGGVGIAVTCTPQTATSVRSGEPVNLHTTLVVREDSLTVYGFTDADQRDCFEAVQLVSGVGPRTAMALLATLTPDDLRKAIGQEDLAVLVRVPGIGRKGAQRLVLELKDRLGPVAGSPDAATAHWEDSVRSGLESLGWSRREADAAVSAVAPMASASESPDVAELLRAALRTLDRA